MEKGMLGKALSKGKHVWTAKSNLNYKIDR